MNASPPLRWTPHRVRGDTLPSPDPAVLAIPRCDAESMNTGRGECPFLCRPDWTPHQVRGDALFPYATGTKKIDAIPIKQI